MSKRKERVFNVFAQKIDQRTFKEHKEEVFNQILKIYIFYTLRIYNNGCKLENVRPQSDSVKKGSFSLV